MFHPQFYPQQFINPSQGFFQQPSAAPTFNRSTHNLNFTHDFDRFQMPAHGFTSMPAGGGMPFRIFDFNKQNQPRMDPQRQHHHHQQQQQRWRQNMGRMPHQHQQKHRRTPAFHFQDHSTSYFMTEPIRTSDDRIAIQLTKVHIGPNGDQQRVFVEQEFSNEQEFNGFVRNFRHNFEKAFKHHPSNGTHQTDPNEENPADSKTAGVVVVEEPDEEPKIYQQQAYNAKIESRKAAAAAAAAAASVITPPLTPTSSHSPAPSPPNPTHVEHQPPTHGRTRTRRTRYASPAAATRMSSSSTTRSYRRRRRNKMKYRRQQADQEKGNVQNSFQPPPYPPRYPVTPPPSMHFQQRFFSHETEKNPNRAVPPFQWRFQRPASTFGRPPSSPPNRFRHSQTPPSQMRPTTVADHHRYPTQDQQQPRVHRAKSECHTSRNFQAQRTRSTLNQFQQFSPIQNSPIVHRHFVPFCSAPFLSTAPNIFVNQRRQIPANGQLHLGLFNSCRLGSTRF